MNTLVERCAAQYLTEFSEHDGASLLLFGSALDEGWNSESDIDLFLIADGQTTDVEHRQLGDVTLEIQKDNYQQLLKDLELERGKVRHRNLATMLATAKILRSGQDDLAALQQKAQEVLTSSTEYSAADEKAWRESIDDYLGKCERDLARHDLVAFQIDVIYVIQNLLDLYLATHNSYWPQPKALSARLEQIDPTFAQEFAKMAGAQDAGQKLGHLQMLAAKV